MSEYAELPQPNFEILDNRPYDCPADDVRVAIHQCSGTDADTRAAVAKFAGVMREDNLDPLDAIQGFDQIDQASFQNANVAVALVDDYANKAKYVKPEDTGGGPSENDDSSWACAWRAAKQAMSNTVSRRDYEKMAPHLRSLAHRNGSAADALNNFVQLREQALAGGEQHKQARQTAFSHYRNWNGADPRIADATRDMTQATKAFPDITADQQFKADVAHEIEKGDFPLEFDAVQMTAEARRRVLERKYRG